MMLEESLAFTYTGTNNTSAKTLFGVKISSFIEIIAHSIRIWKCDKGHQTLLPRVWYWKQSMLGLDLVWDQDYYLLVVCYHTMLIQMLWNHTHDEVATRLVWTQDPTRAEGSGEKPCQKVSWALECRHQCWWGNKHHFSQPAFEFD